MTTFATSTITNEAITAFRLRVKGEVLFPGDAGYDEAREIHNATYDIKPAIIVKVQDASDVSRCIHFARQQGLEIAVRSGGHSLAGFSLVEGGLVIDMTAMNAIRIDAAQRTAWVQPGATAGEVGTAAQEFGLAVPFGDAATVGVGGITLGGGIGFLARKHGLTIDHLFGIEMVTAEGQIVHASATEHSELFWGLRGGGGNFGVVTGFQFELVEVGMIYGGLLGVPATTEAIVRYGELAQEAPEGLTTIAMVMYAPPAPFIAPENVGKLILGIFACYTGDLAEGPDVIAPFRELGEPIADVIMPMPYSAIYELTAESTQRRRAKVRSGFFETLSAEMIDKLLADAATMPGPMGLLQLRPLGGQMARVARQATAFSHRDAKYMIAVIDLWDEVEADAAHDSWVDVAWASIAPYHEGVYSNFLANEGEKRLRTAYSEETYERLADLKLRYDPQNVFRRNQNIAPRRASAAA